MQASLSFRLRFSFPHRYHQPKIYIRLSSSDTLIYLDITYAIFSMKGQRRVAFRLLSRPSLFLPHKHIHTLFSLSLLSPLYWLPITKKKKKKKKKNSRNMRCPVICNSASSLFRTAIVWKPIGDTLRDLLSTWIQYKWITGACARRNSLDIHCLTVIVVEKSIWGPEFKSLIRLTVSLSANASVKR